VVCGVFCGVGTDETDVSIIGRAPEGYHEKTVPIGLKGPSEIRNSLPPNLVELLAHRIPATGSSNTTNLKIMASQTPKPNSSPASSTPKEGGFKQVQLDWSSANELPLFYATTFSTTISPDGVILAIGQAFPPSFPGTPHQQLEALNRLKILPVIPVARVMLNAAHLAEIIVGLQNAQTMLQNLPEVPSNFQPEA